MRKRDERFKDQGRHKAQPDPLYDKAHPKKTAGLPAQGLRLRPRGRHLHLSGRQALYQNGANCRHNGHLAVKFQGAQRDCVPCNSGTNACGPRRRQRPGRSASSGARRPTPVSHSDRMKRAIDSATTDGPLRPALCHGGTGVRQHPRQQGLDRFTLRGQQKVDGAVEALLPGAQHREAGAPRVCTVGQGRTDQRVGAGDTARRKSDQAEMKMAR
jgi:hypothetical protein